ncbi:hypothetical protein [Brevibacillus laterosporus]|uniref:hypothetical protein n=1 Tax=Brevibacillus laterosporus TaxID=1465 RepID=UPI001F31251A|nr:hypothetical protein [Brevibacillus laterosporus]
MLRGFASITSESFHDNPFMLTSGEEFIANDEQVAAGIDTFWNDPNKVAFIAECEKDLIGIMTVTPKRNEESTACRHDCFNN